MQMSFLIPSSISSSTKNMFCAQKKEKKKRDRIVMLFFTVFSGFLCSRVSSDVLEPLLVFLGSVVFLGPNSQSGEENLKVVLPICQTCSCCYTQPLTSTNLVSPYLNCTLANTSVKPLSKMYCHSSNILLLCI